MTLTYLRISATRLVPVEITVGNLGRIAGLVAE